MNQKKGQRYLFANKLSNILVRVQIYAMCGLVAALSADPINKIAVQYFSGQWNEDPYPYSVEIG